MRATSAPIRACAAAVAVAALLVSGWPASADHDGPVDVVPQPIDVPPDLESGDRFGVALDSHGDWLAVSDRATEFRVHLYERVNGEWLHRDVLTGAFSIENYGSAIAMELPWLVVGASGMGSGGGAYVYKLTDGAWTHHGNLTSEGLNPGEVRTLGAAAAISGDRIALGAPFHERGTQNFAPQPGAVYVYERDASDDAWHLASFLQPANLGDQDRFGHALTFHADTLVVGAPYHDRLQGRLGSLTFFERNATEWIQTHQDYFIGSHEVVGQQVVSVGDRVVTRAKWDTLVMRPNPSGSWTFEGTLERALTSTSSFPFRLDASGTTVVETGPDGGLALRTYLGNGAFSLEFISDANDPRFALRPGGVALNGREILLGDWAADTAGQTSGDLKRNWINHAPDVGLWDVPPLECVNGHATHRVFAYDTSDPDGDAYTMHWPAPYFDDGQTPRLDARGAFPFGETTTTVSATDVFGLTGSAPLTVEVVDTLDPSATLNKPWEGRIHIRNLTIPFPDGIASDETIVLGPYWFTLSANDRCALAEVRLESSVGDTWTWNAAQWPGRIEFEYDVYPEQSGNVTLTLTATDHLGRQRSSSIEYVHIGTREDVGLGIWNLFDIAHGAAYEACYDVGACS